MIPSLQRMIVLKSRPAGLPEDEDFELVRRPLPALEPGQILIRHDWLGLAPAARLRMHEGDSYAPPMALGDVIHAQAVGEVLASRNDRFRAGDAVLSMHAGWSTHSVSDGHTVYPIDPAIAPPTVWLGALGSSGMTAWIGLHEIGALRAADTVVVSSAAGAVGSVAGQLAAMRGARVVGIAGGAAKCLLAVGEYGYAACVDHRSPSLAADLARACPAGVDLYFDNVGGAVRDAVWPLMNRFGRVVVCGLISEYNSGFVPGPAWHRLLTQRLAVRGFIVSDHAERRGEFVAEVGAMVRDGRLRVREDAVDGLENAPAAFIRMLQGGNVGKTLVRITDGPGRADGSGTPDGE